LLGVSQIAGDASSRPPLGLTSEKQAGWTEGLSRSEGVRQQPAEASNPEQREAISSAVGSQPAARGVYVYGIVDCTELAGLPAEGVAAGYPVTLLAYRDLAAVVSEVPLDEWGQEALEARLADLEWLEARVRTHQAVLDAVLPLTTLAPMKFATIYLSPEGVTEFLATHHDEFVALLGHLHGRQEWGLKLYCDDETLAAHIAEISPDVARLRAEIVSKPKGAAYLLARKLQETSDQESERVEMAVAERTHTALTDQSVAAGLNPLQSAEITGRTERMLLNGAYLVDAAALDTFQAALAEIAAEFGGRGFQFELSGPWPAYNFTRLGDRKGAFVAKAVIREREVSLLELLDRILDKGVVIAGDLVISVADIDLIYLGLKVILTSVETMEKHTARHTLSAAAGVSPEARVQQVSE
jgi:hypothetical protein